MYKKLLGTIGVGALLATSLATAPAHAAGVTVTSPRCQVLRISNTNSTAQVVNFDSRHEVTIPANRTIEYVEVTTGAKIPAGEYKWMHGTKTTGTPAYAAGMGRVKVGACSSSAVTRPVEGDQNKDGRADVLGIQASTGNLFYYRMTSTGLVNTAKAGTGWNNMIFMQQVNEVEGEGTGNKLISVRNDGTVWMYNNYGYGRFGSARRIGTGFGGYTAFTVTQLNSNLYFGGHLLLARKGDVLYAWEVSGSSGLVGLGEVGRGFGTTVKLMSLTDFDKDNAVELLAIRSDGNLFKIDINSRIGGLPLLSAPVNVGHGWTRMQTVTSPGSLDGDNLSDLVARRDDGNLYKYTNKGGYWGPATQIGKNWNGIRLLA